MDEETVVGREFIIKVGDATGTGEKGRKGNVLVGLAQRKADVELVTWGLEL